VLEVHVGDDAHLAAHRVRRVEAPADAALDDGPVASGLLEDQVLYTLRPKDVAALEGRGLRPGDLRVTASGVEITLLPVAR